MATSVDYYVNNSLVPISMKNGDNLHKHFDGFILLEDWLRKSPPDKQYKHEHRWKWRYFLLLKLNERHYVKDSPVKKFIDKKGNRANELSEFCLTYWESKEDRDKGTRPIRAIPLEYCTAEVHSHPFWEGKFPHMISLKMKDRKRDYFLCTINESTKRLWFDALKQATQADSQRLQYRKEKPQVSDDIIHEPIYEFPDDYSRVRRPSESTCRTWTGDSGYASRPPSATFADADEEDIYEDFTAYNIQQNNGLNSSMNTRLCFSSPDLVNISDRVDESPYDLSSSCASNINNLIKSEQAKSLDMYNIQLNANKGILKEQQSKPYGSVDGILNNRTFTCPAQPTKPLIRISARPKSVHFGEKHRSEPALSHSETQPQLTKRALSQPQAIKQTLPLSHSNQQTVSHTHSMLLNSQLTESPLNELTTTQLNSTLYQSPSSEPHIQPQPTQQPQAHSSQQITTNVYDIPNCEISTIKRVRIGKLIVELPTNGKVSYHNDKVIIHADDQIFQIMMLE